MSTRIYCYGRIRRNPSITDTIGNQNFVRYRGVPSSGFSGILPVGVVCAIGLLSTTWLRFQSFAVRWQGMLVLRNSANLTASC